MVYYHGFILKLLVLLQWEIEKVEEGNYVIRIMGNRYATAEGRDVRVEENDRGFRWHIIRSAPHPEPIGQDNFGYAPRFCCRPTLLKILWQDSYSRTSRPPAELGTP